MESRPIRSAAPPFEPVTLAQAKAQCRIGIDNIDHDEELTLLIQQAREKFENDTSVICATGTFALRMECFDDDEIDLPLRPVTSVTSITYVDTAGTTQTFSGANYSLSNSEAMPEIVLGYLKLWPITRGHHDDVTVTFVAGYATEATVPASIKQAILLEVGAQWSGKSVERAENFGYQALSRRYERPTYP